MMGAGHASTSLAVGALTIPLAPVHDVPSQLAWILVVGGAGYLPDMDQATSTAGRTFGPITGIMARVVSFVGRGHRGGSHDILFAAPVTAGLFYLASLNPWTATFAVGLAIALAFHALDVLVPGKQKALPLYSFLLSMTWAAWLVSQGSFTWWLPIAAAVGVVVHIVGDALTVDGIPYPLSWLSRKRTFGLRLFPAGHPVEKWITWVSLGVCVAATAWFVAWPYLARLIGFGA